MFHLDHHHRSAADGLVVRRRLVVQVPVRHGRAVHLEPPVVPERATPLLIFPEIFACSLARWKRICPGKAQVNFEASEKAAGKVFAGTHENTERRVVALLKAIPANHHGELLAPDHKRIAVEPMTSLDFGSLMHFKIIDRPDVCACPLRLRLRSCFHIERSRNI